MANDILSNQNFSIFLKHKDECISLFSSYDQHDGTKTIDDLVKNIDKLSKLKYSSDDDRNLFVGEIFELFTELFFVINSADPKVGLTRYNPIPVEEDYGVDAIATNVNGIKCVVQVKFRTNPLCKITYEDISKTYTSGREVHSIDVDKADSMFLFTTAFDITDSCKHVFKKNQLRVINKNIISSYIDSNNTFWEKLASILYNSVNYYCPELI